MSCLVLGACIFDWDSFDPRAGNDGGSTASAGMGGEGGLGGAGGSGGADGGAPPGIWTVQPLEALSSDFDDDDPTFTDDLLELYFNSDRGGGYDIWLSSRPDAAEPWGEPVAVTALNSTSGENNGVVAPDGLSFWVSSQRDGQATSDIYQATRADRNSSWSTPTLVAELSDDTASESVSAVSADTLTMIMTRGGDLYLTTRPTTSDPWAVPEAIDELNSVGFEGEAWLGPEQLTLYFDTVRANVRNIVMSTRSDASAAWGEPLPVLDWNSAEDEGDPWLSSDMMYGVFSRGPRGERRQIYEARQ